MNRDPLALAIFAAWCNLPVDKLPEAMRAHTCPATAEAWGRVADTARTALLGPDGLDWLESASLAGADVLNNAQRETIARLAAALHQIAADFDDFPTLDHEARLDDWSWHRMAVEQRDIARAALSANAVSAGQSGKENSEIPDQGETP